MPTAQSRAGRPRSGIPPETGRSFRSEGILPSIDAQRRTFTQSISREKCLCSLHVSAGGSGWKFALKKKHSIAMIAGPATCR